ncbi:MAG: hypothetical protein KKF20_04555 [Bacteroidetes bacterium]|nr:hypothetical protein [Bacteroidota bacterium]MBU2471658.1 hypothetical protein [Bacteroidota bacterium]MBU2636197.1 hypothetical protein [Bacteroidota bacterium]
MGTLDFQLMIALKMVAGESTDTLLRVLDSVFAYKVRDAQLHKEFNDIIRKLRDVNTRRNQHIHALWFITDKSTAHKVRFIKGKKGQPIEWDSINVDVTEIEKLADEILYATSELEKFTRSHFKI